MSEDVRELSLVCEHLENLTTKLTCLRDELVGKQDFNLAELCRQHVVTLGKMYGEFSHFLYSRKVCEAMKSSEKVEQKTSTRRRDSHGKYIDKVASKILEVMKKGVRYSDDDLVMYHNESPPWNDVRDRAVHLMKKWYEAGTENISTAGELADLIEMADVGYASLSKEETNDGK